MISEYVGSNSQLFDVKEYRLFGGRSEGVRAVDVWNGGNLFFTVLPDRSLDIYTTRYKNNNMSYLSPSGVVAPQYYNDASNRWLKSYNGGLFVTCGLQNIGNPDGSSPDVTMHGHMANLPADSVSVNIAPDGRSVRISGVIKEAYAFLSNYSVCRTIECRLGCDEITLTDEVTNNLYVKAPLSMLYHFNFGYPLISEKAKMCVPSASVYGTSKLAADHIDTWNKITPPVPGIPERCYAHKLSEYRFAIENPEINTRMQVEYDSDKNFLDHFMEWQEFKCGNYVLGLEPGTCTMAGRTNAMENGSMKYLEAGETVVNKLKISFSELH